MTSPLTALTTTGSAAIMRMHYQRLGGEREDFCMTSEITPGCGRIEVARSGSRLSRRTLLRRAGSIAVGLPAIGVLAACGGAAEVAASTSAATTATSAVAATASITSTSASGTAANSPTTESAATSASSTGVSAQTGVVSKAQGTLRLFDYDSQPSEAPKQDLLKQFTQQTGYQVELDPDIPGAFEEKLLVQVASGSAPDVTKAYGDPLFTLIDRDAIVDISAQVARDVSKAEIADWLPSQYHMFFDKGHQYALPKYCSSHVYFGNKALFRQAGVDFPTAKTTWDQLRSAGASLTKKQGETYTQFALNNGMANLSGFLSQIVWSWGGEVVDPNDNSKCLLDQPAALDALQYVQDLIWKDHIAPQPNDVKALGSDLFGNAKFATEESGSSSLRDLRLQHPQLELDFFPNPLGPTGKTANYHTTDCYALLKGSASKNTDGAWQLLRFVTQPAWARMLIQVEQMQPARQSLAKEWLASVRSLTPTLQTANLEVFVTALAQARPQLRFANDPKALAILNPVIDAVYNKNTSTARTAFAQAAPQVTAALKAASSS
jgi:multiple sugar transport system substrate-binding protein